jgi:hypothetical protein
MSVDKKHLKFLKRLALGNNGSFKNDKSSNNDNLKGYLNEKYNQEYDEKKFMQSNNRLIIQILFFKFIIRII